MFGSTLPFTSIHLKGDSHIGYLSAAFSLRHQVFCQDSGMFRGNTQTGLESDEFDPVSEHFVVKSTKDVHILATVRLVKYQAGLGFPTGKYYGDLEHKLRNLGMEHVGEISRLCIARGSHHASPPVVRFASSPDFRMQHYSFVLLHLFKRLYQASRQLGLRYWLVSMEDSLHRLLVRYNLHFSPLTTGYIEYHGKVRVFLAEIDELERILRVNDSRLLAFFQSQDEPLSH